jgi:hypothetical protein
MTLTEIYKKIEPYIIRLTSTPEDLATTVGNLNASKTKVLEDLQYLEKILAEIEHDLIVLGLPEEEAKSQLAALVQALKDYYGVTDPIVVPPPPPPPPVEDPVVSPPPPPPPPPVEEPVLGIVREVPIFDGEFKFGGQMGGLSQIVPFEGKPAIKTTAAAWQSGGLNWNSQGTPRYLKFSFWKPANTTGVLTLRHTAGWNTIELKETNADKWFVDGAAATNFAAIPTDKWVEVTVNLEAFNINEFKAVNYFAHGDGGTVYFANVGFDTFFESAPVVLPPPPPPPPPPAPPVTGYTLDTFGPITKYNYNGIWHPIEGPQPGKQPDGWSFLYDNIVLRNGELVHLVNDFGNCGIKWESEKRARKTQGHYIVEATMPVIENGLVCAPLWLYSEGAVEPYHEFDFELMNRRIEYNLHNGRGGFNMKKVEKDLSGHKVRFEIIRRPNVVTMRVTSLTDGFTDELVITPELVAQWSQRTGAPAELRFPGNNIAMFPMTEFWVSRFPSWTGTWVSGQRKEMVVHGYKFLP